jgi:hypothetical protein
MTKKEKANKAWIKAVEAAGGAVAIHEKTKIRHTTLSIIKNGYRRNGEHHFKYPTPEQAMKISLMGGGLVPAEDLVPEHDFKHIYEYVKMMMKIKRKSAK